MREIVLHLAAFLIVLAGSGTPAAAQTGAVEPPPGEGPTEVKLGLYVSDITNISELANTFDVEVDVESVWHDPRLAFDPAPGEPDRRIFLGPAAEKARTGHWWPQVTVTNLVGSMQLVSQRFVIDADGRATVRARVALRCRTPLDFRRFPFDEQTLALHLQPFTWGANIARLTPNPERTGFAPDFDLPEWEVLGTRTGVVEVTEDRGGLSFSRLTLNIDVRRKSTFYMWKILLPLVTIVALSWVVFWMRESDLARRASVSVTGILTVVAYQFIVASSLPRVAYLTVMDKVMLVSFVMIAATTLVNLLATSKKLKASGADARLDHTCRIAFPVVYFSVLVLLSQILI